MAAENVETYDKGVLVSTRTETIPTEVANRRSLHDRARQALKDNNTYLRLPTPRSAAQNAAQIERLTKEVNGLIRLLLDDLQDVSDT